MPKKKEDFFIPENLKGEPTFHHSPSYKFTLVIQKYSTGPNTWDYSRGIVTNHDEVIADIIRNYGHFPFCFAEKDGKEYLLYGEDYQGYGILDLETGERKDYLPTEAKKGFGFCWAEIKQEGGNLLVNGCFWACPYENVTYDFSNPMELPYKELKREPEEPEEEESEDDGG